MGSTAFYEIARLVIGDLSVPFEPSVDMKVYHNNNMMINGRDYRASAVATAPRVTIGGSPNELYTLVLIDPDAPNPNEPSLKEVVSWIVTNIPGGSMCGRGTEFLEYNAPAPEIGVHRNIFVLYKQEGTLDGIEAPASRTCFNAHEFASKHNLSPVGLAYYNVRRELRKRKNLA
ncbi:Phosphatidylethanolamine-binding protein PEBP [Artemisia annua]|uniref:Phosphatidylethanolamine-binding protein PEBP n=1 Tax=Artemisia annua TaxID=35608 RepID=A0A2U1P9L0_ARTAN|nr:Phosphatidylethanolamine-binding protein PEBP [Artemisia annua]